MNKTLKVIKLSILSMVLLLKIVMIFLLASGNNSPILYASADEIDSKIREMCYSEGSNELPPNSSALCKLFDFYYWSEDNGYNEKQVSCNISIAGVDRRYSNISLPVCTFLDLQDTYYYCTPTIDYRDDAKRVSYRQGSFDIINFLNQIETNVERRGIIADQCKEIIGQNSNYILTPDDIMNTKSSYNYNVFLNELMSNDDIEIKIDDIAESPAVINRQNESFDLNLVAGYGDVCEINYSECPSGYNNLLSGIATGKINVYGFSKSETINTLRKSYGDSKVNNLCLRSDLTQIFPRLGFAHSSNRTANYPSRTPTYPVACPSSWNVVRGERRFEGVKIFGFSILGGSSAPYACCPPGKVFMNQEVSLGAHLSFLDGTNSMNAQSGVCVNPSDPVSQVFDGGEESLIAFSGSYESAPRVDGAGNLLFPYNEYGISLSISSIVSQATGESQLMELIAARNIPPVISALHASNSSYNYLHNTNPQYGLGIGKFIGITPQELKEHYYNLNDEQIATLHSYMMNSDPVKIVGGDIASQPRVLEQNSLEIAEFRCPQVKMDGCMIDTSGNSIDPKLYANADVNISGKFVGDTCAKCFGINEPIKLVNENKGVLVCTGNGKTEEMGLIGGSLQTTLAWFRADEVNKPHLASCAEQGGIYTALGCIDPTPVGIITGLIRITLGMIGGISLVQVILAGLAYQSGQEEQIQSAKKRLFATFGGLVLLIFSIVLLRIVGVNVLDVVPEGLF